MGFVPQQSQRIMNSVGDHVREHQQRTSSYPLSFSTSHSSGASGLVATQGEISRNGFYDPLGIPPPNTRPSSGVSLPIQFSASQASFGGLPSMSRDDNRSDTSGFFTEHPPLTIDIHAQNSQPHPHRPSSNSVLQPPSQNNPSLFPSGVPAAQSYLATHGPNLQIAPGNLEQSASLSYETPPFFSFHPLPSQFAPRPSHTPYNILPGQIMMSIQAPPFQSQLSLPHVYQGHHPIEPGPYPPTRYSPLPRSQPPPYLQHVAGCHPAYGQAQQLAPRSQTIIGAPAPSYIRSYSGIQHYPPHFYSSIGNLGLPQQPSTYQWYHDPSSSTAHSPTTYSYHQTQRPRRDSSTLTVHSTGSERLPLSSQDPSSSIITVPTPRDATSPSPGDLLEGISGRSSPKMDTHQPSNTFEISVPRIHDSPPTLSRRHYHPNPPPNRSEWVMWVGNVPGDATHDEVWRFLKHSIPGSSGSGGGGEVEDSGVISIFLISRSHCAFANYQSEEHLNRAISQFSGRKLRPNDHRCPPLVCRTRQKEDDLRAGVGAQRGMGVHTHYVKKALRKDRKSSAVGEETTSSRDRRSKPLKAGDPSRAPSGSKNEESPKLDNIKRTTPETPTRSLSSDASTSSSFLSRHFPKRFFILKSLTRYDLDLSNERGLWATQKHNEAILDQAYRTSKEVILIFSVNKSGEFHGYARMDSAISRSNCNVSWAPRADSFPSTSLPSSACTPTRGTPEQRASPLHQSPEKHTSPSERQVGVSPEARGDPSAASSHAIRFAQTRRSAPRVLDYDCEDPVGPDPPLRLGFSSGHKGRPRESRNPVPPLDSDFSLTTRPELRKYHGTRAGTRSKRNGSDSDDPNKAGSLLLAARETHSEFGVEEEDQPTSTTISSAAMHRRLEGQERGSNWGGTFKVKWLCTQQVQFHRTRHLRNPWNHGREIKVSRDGTELEPGVGQQLLDMWSTLASERTRGDGARHIPSLTSKRGPKPGPSVEPKDVKEEAL